MKMVKNKNFIGVTDKYSKKPLIMCQKKNVRIEKG